MVPRSGSSEFFDQDNIGIDTKVMTVSQLLLPICSILDFNGGHIVKWLRNGLRFLGIALSDSPTKKI